MKAWLRVRRFHCLSIARTTTPRAGEDAATAVTLGFIPKGRAEPFEGAEDSGGVAIHLRTRLFSRYDTARSLTQTVKWKTGNLDRVPLTLSRLPKVADCFQFSSRLLVKNSNHKRK